MATYAFREGVGGDVVLADSRFVKPIPVHAQRPGALEAVEAVRRAAVEKRFAVELDKIVTDHGRPRREPYVAQPPAALRLAKLAEAHGFRVNLVVGVDRLTVEGIRDAEAFRMTYVRGKAERGSWHERTARYAMIRDTRPIGVNKLTRTGLAGKRAAGVGEYRLSIVASPTGVPCSVTEIERRIKAS